MASVFMSTVLTVKGFIDFAAILNLRVFMIFTEETFGIIGKRLDFI
jgi:hypothetical protein